MLANLEHQHKDCLLEEIFIFKENKTLLPYTIYFFLSLILTSETFEDQLSVPDE